MMKTLERIILASLVLERGHKLLMRCWNSDFSDTLLATHGGSVLLKSLRGRKVLGGFVFLSGSYDEQLMLNTL